jgi:hypothetical protein
MADKHHSEETRRKMRLAQPNLGKKVGPRSRESIAKGLETKARRRAENQQGDTLF